MAAIPLFHLAFPVDDLNKAREFYGGLLGCSEGRSSREWVDFNFMGTRSSPISLPTKPAIARPARSTVITFRLATSAWSCRWREWQKLADRLSHAGVNFMIEPHVRFKGQPGEQATMFFLDPSGNALEFKAFDDMSRVFAK